MEMGIREDQAVGLPPGAVDLAVADKQLLGKTCLRVDRPLDVCAVEQNLAEDDGVLEAEVGFDPQIAGVDVALDHRMVDDDRIGKVEADEVTPRQNTAPMILM